MTYENCKLYNLKSKKMLKYLLKIGNSRMFNQAYVASSIEPYIDSSGKPRIIEPPSYELKRVQSRVKKLLYEIEVDSNVFSGIKGRSYAQNARMHKGNNYAYKIDLKAFFPSISRGKVYDFFKEEMKTAPDIAEFLTNVTTIDIDLSASKNMDEVDKFLEAKKVKTRNHLISGSPASSILSYLVNQKMFDEMQNLTTKNHIIMTIYIDDIVFSSPNKISNNFKYAIHAIIKKYGYRLSKVKIKGYSKNYPKLITGAIIDKNGGLKVKNSLRQKIITTFKESLENPDDMTIKSRLRGLVTASRQIESNAYPAIREYAFRKQ